jgi:hypothetical protein
MGAHSSYVALETADIALAGNDLRNVAAVVELSGHALRVVRQNYTLAIGVNLAGITAGAGGSIQPRPRGPAAQHRQHRRRRQLRPTGATHAAPAARRHRTAAGRTAGGVARALIHSYSYSDGARWRLGSRLGYLLQDLERLAAEAERQEQEQELREADQRRRWYAAVARAREKQIEQHRVMVLTGQMRAWRQAADSRAFYQAARARAGDALGGRSCPGRPRSTPCPRRWDVR